MKRPNVEVRARKGYWALTSEEVEKATAAPKAGPPREISEALEELGGLVEPASRRPVVIWLGAVRGPAEKATVMLSWEVDGDRATNPAETADKINITATSIYGDLLYRGQLTRDADAPIARGRVTFDAPPGGVRVRVVAENARGLRLEPQDSTYEVPDFTTPGPTITSPAVYRGRTVRDLQQVRLAEAPVPTATRLFSRTRAAAAALRRLRPRRLDTQAHDAPPQPARRADVRSAASGRHQGQQVRVRGQSRPAAAGRLPDRDHGDF